MSFWGVTYLFGLFEFKFQIRINNCQGFFLLFDCKPYRCLPLSLPLRAGKKVQALQKSKNIQKKKEFEKKRLARNPKRFNAFSVCFKERKEDRKEMTMTSNTSSHVPLLAVAFKRRLKAMGQQIWHLAPSANCFT
jgi:hypothetical protein